MNPSVFIETPPLAGNKSIQQAAVVYILDTVIQELQVSEWYVLCNCCECVHVCSKSGFLLKPPLLDALSVPNYLAWAYLVRSKKGAKYVPCKCTGMVTVVTHTTVWWNVLMAFLHNRAAESHEILSECSHQ